MSPKNSTTSIDQSAVAQLCEMLADANQYIGTSEEIEGDTIGTTQTITWTVSSALPHKQPRYGPNWKRTWPT